MVLIYHVIDCVKCFFEVYGKQLLIKIEMINQMIINIVKHNNFTTYN